MQPFIVIVNPILAAKQNPPAPSFFIKGKIIKHLTEILKDKRIYEDLIDIAIAESRAKDKSRLFSDFLKEYEH